MNGTTEFLSQRRLAIVGVSQNPKDFTRAVFRAFRERDYDVVPVNPKAKDIEGRPCYSCVKDAKGLDAALVMTPPEISERVVMECAEAGIRRIWLFRRAPAAEAFCESRGISVVAGECPLMFLPGAGWIHRLHAWFKGYRHGEQLVQLS